MMAPELKAEIQKSDHAADHTISDGLSTRDSAVVGLLLVVLAGALWTAVLRANDRAQLRSEDE